MSATDALEQARQRLAAEADGAVVTSAVDASWLHELAIAIDARPDHEVPLRGKTFAVKDNIDVAGTPTTAACPSFSVTPTCSATVIDRLVAAGALPIAKVNLDQFASGLVGTRSPYGTPPNPLDPRLVPGGSSSGSAVAVATGLVDFALGTDTAGSGRVPAALCGIVGVKPTPGWLSCYGVVPAVQSIDCVSVFARSIAEAMAVTEVASGVDSNDPYSRPAPHLAAAPVRRIGVVSFDTLSDLSVGAGLIADYGSAVERLRDLGCSIEEFDPSTLFAMGDALYGDAWVTERRAAVEAFLRADPPDVDPTVARVFHDATRYSVADVHRARHQLSSWRRTVDDLWSAVDAIALPTVGWHPTLDDVRIDPAGTNQRLGRFTTFTNLAGLATIAFPLSAVPEVPPFSLSLHGPAWSDRSLAELAALLTGEPCIQGDLLGWVRLAVAGAHLRGQPLESQLVDRGARWLGTTTTSATYRLFAMAGTSPPKPAVVHDRERGRAIEVDVWSLSPAALGDFLQTIPAPLCLGRLELVDGSAVTGFLAEPRALDQAVDITDYGGWRAYRAGDEA